MPTPPKAIAALRTRACALGIDVHSGMLADFQFAGKENYPWRDYYIPWNDRRFGVTELYRRQGGLRITDELTGIEYRDEFGTGMTYYNETRKSHTFPKGTPCRVSDVRRRRRGSTTFLAFRKQFAGAPFVLDYRFEANPRDIRWDLFLRLRRGEAPRSVRIEFVIPTMAAPVLSPKWNVWAPVAGAPFPFTSPGGYGHEGGSWELLRFPYACAKGDLNLVVPVIALYSEPDNTGLAIAVPFDLHKPELIFEVDKLLSETRIIYGNLGLRPRAGARASILLHAHEGDWRPALGWLFKKYTDYFTAGDPKIADQEGPMCYNYPVLSERVIRAWKRRLHFSWTEVPYSPTFGNFVPREDAWVFDMLKSPRQPDCEIPLTRAKLRAYFKLLRKYGVASFAYFNVGECESKIAEEKYPESLITLDHGQRAWQWPWPDKKRRNWEMNPDPHSRWGRDLLRQLDVLFRTYPELDGIFLDQLCYRAYDFSRDDGCTMLHNRPCFDTSTVVPDMVAAIVKILRRHKRTAFTNGPVSIEVQKGLDGIMSEGRIGGLAQYAHIALAKAVMILTYGCPLGQFEHTLKQCLKYGAFPDVRDHLTMKPRKRISPEEQSLYDRYLPLLETLRGRRWVLHAHALKLPAGYDGNIFRDRRGRYVVTAFPRECLAVDRQNQIEREIVMRLPDAGRVRSALWLSANFSRPRRVPLRRAENGAYQLRIPAYADASVFVIGGGRETLSLFPTGTSRSRIRMNQA